LEIYAFLAQGICIGDIRGARQQYHEIYSKIDPGSLEAAEAHANFERILVCGGESVSYYFFFVNIQDLGLFLSFQGHQFMIYEDAITADRKMGKVSGLPALLVQYASFGYGVGLCAHLLLGFQYMVVVRLNWEGRDE
jgi:hypothetical protein